MRIYESNDKNYPMTIDNTWDKTEIPDDIIYNDEYWKEFIKELNEVRNRLVAKR